MISNDIPSIKSIFTPYEYVLMYCNRCILHFGSIKIIIPKMLMKNALHHQPEHHQNRRINRFRFKRKSLVKGCNRIALGSFKEMKTRALDHWTVFPAQINHAIGIQQLKSLSGKLI